MQREIHKERYRHKKTDIDRQRRGETQREKEK